METAGTGFEGEVIGIPVRHSRPAVFRGLGVAGGLALLGAVITLRTADQKIPLDSTARVAAAPTPVIFIGGVRSIDSLVRADSGKWVLVNFWATWCRPCVAETPDLVALHRALHGRPFTIVGVSLDFAVFGESTAIRKVTQFGAQSKVEYPNVIFNGKPDVLTSHFHLSGAIPTSILYDPKGQEKARWVGSLDAEDLAKIKSFVS